MSGRLEPWAASCPLQLTSPNAPSNRDTLGTARSAILAGHQRIRTSAPCAWVSTIDAAARHDGGGGSEDSVRRKLGRMDEAAGVKWLQDHLDEGVSPLLSIPWTPTAMSRSNAVWSPGRAEKGYNPHKPGRPSHTYHTYFIAHLRLILDVEVQAGTETASSSAPGLREPPHAASGARPGRSSSAATGTGALRPTCSAPNRNGCPISSNDA